MTLAPLAGVAVVAAGDDLAMRLCARMLADAGAQVRRVAPGDDALLDAPHGADWAAFADEGTAAADDAESALADADLLLTSHSHDHHLGCTAVAARHPHLTTACVTPYGQSGPYAGEHADDVVLAALAGLSDATPGLPDQADTLDDPPVQSLAPLAQAGGALIGALAIVGALMPRLRGESGPRHVEVASIEASAALMVYEWAIAAYGGGLRGRRPIPIDPAPNTYLPTRDGTAVIVAPSPAHWQSLVSLMGDPAWAQDPDFADGASRCAHWSKLEPLLAAWTANQGGDELTVAAQRFGLPITGSLELAQTLASEQVAVTGAVRTADGRPVAADPITVNGRRRARPVTPPPRARLGPVGGAAHAPLAGLRVVDFGQFVAGPYCGQLLAALGAEVTLIEPPGFPVSRVFGPFVGTPKHDAGAIFNQINRGKRSVQLDLRSQAGRDAVRGLVARADIVLENYSREAAEKLGLTYEDLAAVRPDLIGASISGFGRTGPGGDYVALHSGVLLLSGSASVTRDERGRMHLVGAIYPDVLTGTATALAIEQAVMHRAATGEGSHVEIAMMDVILNCMGGLLPSAAAGERHAAHPSAHFLRAADGGFVAVSGALADGVAAEVAAAPKHAAAQALRGRGVRAAAVQTIEEVMRDPHLTARALPMIETHPVAGERCTAALPWLVDGERPSLSPAPQLGAATDEILATIGAKGS